MFETTNQPTVGTATSLQLVVSHHCATVTRVFQIVANKTPPSPQGKESMLLDTSFFWINY
jgi:hypothetical protein